MVKNRQHEKTAEKFCSRTTRMRVVKLAKKKFVEPDRNRTLDQPVPNATAERLTHWANSAEHE
jgi:hypothetical protein